MMSDMILLLNELTDFLNTAIEKEQSITIHLQKNNSIFRIFFGRLEEAKITENEINIEGNWSVYNKTDFKLINITKLENIGNEISFCLIFEDEEVYFDFF